MSTLHAFLLIPAVTPSPKHPTQHPPRMEPILGTDKLPAARLALTCGVCKQQYGACIQVGGKV